MNEKSTLAYYLAQGEPKESTLHIFQRNKAEMEKANVTDSDKFYHARANCQAGQNGAIYTPLLLDYLKEGYDIFKKVIYPKNNKPLSINIQDSFDDLEADYYGLKRGLMYKDKDCSTLLDKYKVNGLEDY